MAHIRARSTRSRVGAQHADWLSLVEPSGQFLTIPTLKRAFPNGLPTIDAEQRREVREWAASLDHDNTAEATAWLEYLLGDLLGWGSRLLSGPSVPDHLSHTVAEHHTTLRPEYVLADKDKQPRVLVERYPTGTRLDARLPGELWAATPIERTATLCRALGVPVGIVTDSRYLVLLYAPIGAVGGHATWDTALFAEGAESTLLEALVAVLAAQRFFAVGTGDRLEDLLEESASAQAELTNTLGLQVRRAVELLVAAISKSNVEAEGRYLRGVTPHRVYEAAATTVMRLVFLLYAEERQLLPLGEELYDDNYAVATLGQQLSEESDRTGDEPLELRSAAWHRLLATFRAVFAGVSHDRLRMPPYGGSLFDPDRFPFLEGRAPGQTWTGDPSHPVPVDDLTVREILDALQWISTTEGGVTEARRLSFRALDVEQIGHVYEGTLDHSALVADEVIVGLVGKPGNEPEVALAELESHLGNDLEDFLLETTGKTKRQISALLAKPLDDEAQRRIRTAVDNDEALVVRLAPFAHLLRDDLRGLPTVFTPGTVYVTETSHRRDTGTEYTPRELADEIVLHALEPLVYEPGPAQGAERSDWRLKSSSEILTLRVCDPAVGSGAILVAACRYLADRVVEAWIAEGSVPDGYAPDPNVIADGDEVTVLARRAVADQCIYGVDRDPMAVEMAKLSLWLTTMSRERPFTFVDHAIRAGDSLLGLTSLDQVTAFHMDPDRGRSLHKDLLVDLESSLKPLVDEVLEIRQDITALPVITVRDVERKAAMNARAEHLLATATAIADAVVGAALCSGGKDTKLDDLLLASRPRVVAAAHDPGALPDLVALAQEMLDRGRPSSAPVRHPLHWALAFPEVMQGGGFDAVVGNPPYIGNKYWKSRIGPDFQSFWSLQLGAPLGKPDLMAVFLRAMTDLLRSGGLVGSLSTQSISEVDSRRFMERHVLGDFKYVRAISRRAWPGNASVEISQVWISDSLFAGQPYLDGQRVPFIDAGLGAQVESQPEAAHIGEIEAFQGIDNSRGLAMVVNEDHPILTSQDGSALLFRPYLSGADLTEAPPLAPRRYALDLTGFSEAELNSLPPKARDFLLDVVRPTRTPKALTSYKGLSDRWWTFWNTRESDLSLARQQDHLIAMPAISQYLVALMLPSEWAYTNKVFIPHGADRALQALLLSCAFDAWFSETGGTFGTSGRVLKVKPVLGTFPLPRLADVSEAEAAAQRWQDLVTANGSIPNKVLGAMHSRADLSAGTSLRENQVILDLGILAAYGWDDIDPQHDYYDTTQGVRFTIAPSAREVLLRRLFELNQERQTQQIQNGGHAKGERRRPGSAAARVNPRNPPQGNLF